MRYCSEMETCLEPQLFSKLGSVINSLVEQVFADAIISTSSFSLCFFYN